MVITAADLERIMGEGGLVSKYHQRRQFEKNVKADVRELFLKEIFGQNYRENYGFAVAKRIIGPKVMEQLDWIIDFYYKSYNSRNKREGHHDELPAMLYFAAIELERRGMLKNARDLYIFAGYACQLRDQNSLIDEVNSSLIGLLSGVPKHQKQNVYPEWYVPRNPISHREKNHLLRIRDCILLRMKDCIVLTAARLNFGRKLDQKF